MAIQQGWNQLTHAATNTIRNAIGKKVRSAFGGTRRRKTRSKKAAAPRARRAKSRGKMTKGSAAAKAWGRKMRALRKK
jgi:hypothetical protein